MALGSRSVALAFAAFFLAVPVPAAALAPAAAVERFAPDGGVAAADDVLSACGAYAQVHATGTWMCDGITVTDVAPGGAATVANVRTGARVRVASAARPTQAEQRAVDRIASGRPAAPDDDGTDGDFQALAVIDESRATRATTSITGAAEPSRAA